MQAHLIFQKISPALGKSIIQWMRDDEKQVYKAAVQTLAQQRKVRPIYITQKHRDAQTTFLLDSMKMKLTEGVGENVLQVWLMKGRPQMLADFLDTLGIGHDGKGGVEGDLPENFDAGKVAEGADKLLAKYPAEEVFVYLSLFQLQRPGGWPEIAAAIEKCALPA
jgi:hypothetical protein